MSKVDLSVTVKGVTFPNPVMPGSSDLVCDDTGVVRCLKSGVGGIVTKTVTSTAFRTKARPYHFYFRRFGLGLNRNWISKGSVDVKDPEVYAEKHMPTMARHCHDAGVPLIVSIMCSVDPEEWVREGKRFQDAGADMLELNLSCPHASFQTGQLSGRTLGEDPDAVAAIIKRLKETVSIPIMPKLSITLGPFLHHVKRWEEAGADLICAHNTTYGMMIDIETELPFGTLGAGGYLMGRSMLPWSLARVVEMRREISVPIVGVGGIYEPMDAIMYMLLGSPLVQIASAAMEHGTKFFKRTVNGIEAWMERKGYSSVDEFVGKAFPLASMDATQELISMERPFPPPQEQSSHVIPLVDMAKCTLCGKCQDFCVEEVFTVNRAERTVLVDHAGKCTGCGDCVGWCPPYAFTLIDDRTGDVVWDNQGLAKPYRPENWKKKPDPATGPVIT